MKLHIRTMRETDLPAVAALEKEIFPDPWSLDAFEDSISYAACGGLVAERIVSQRNTADGEIVGYACYYHAGGETHLTNIAVSPR
ncbi:MAG TPA: hypothetical protein VLB27_06860, partial [candidate division Zixibacteria bacterium]|nr:hypothetical protein [candidate division Zixibacteria bacterium]